MRIGIIHGLYFVCSVELMVLQYCTGIYRTVSFWLYSIKWQRER